MRIYDLLKATPVANTDQFTVQMFSRTMEPSFPDKTPDQVEATLVDVFERIMRGDFLDKQRTEELYQEVLTLAILAPGFDNQVDAHNRIREIIVKRGSSYGNTVLNLLGTQYTSTHALAKILRLLDCYDNVGLLLKDELLDVAGYCVLNRAILECPVKEKTYG